MTLKDQEMILISWISQNRNDSATILQSALSLFHIMPVYLDINHNSIIIFKHLKHQCWKAKRRAPAHSQVPCRIRVVVQRVVH